MNTARILMIVCTLAVATGCGNLSPRFEQRLNNENGKIDEIKNNQNGMMAEIGKLQNQAEIQNSQLEKIQQGMINFQSNNENSGVQILSGNGGLIVSCIGAAALFILAMTTLYYIGQAKLMTKTAKILADQIKAKNDEELTENVFKAAMYTDVEAQILNLVKVKST